MENRTVKIVLTDVDSKQRLRNALNGNYLVIDGDDLEHEVRKSEKFFDIIFNILSEYGYISNEKDKEKFKEIYKDKKSVSTALKIYIKSKSLELTEKEVNEFVDGNIWPNYARKVFEFLIEQSQSYLDEEFFILPPKLSASQVHSANFINFLEILDHVVEVFYLEGETDISSVITKNENGEYYFVNPRIHTNHIANAAKIVDVESTEEIEKIINENEEIKEKVFESIQRTIEERSKDVKDNVAILQSNGKTVQKISVNNLVEYIWKKELENRYEKYEEMEKKHNEATENEIETINQEFDEYNNYSTVNYNETLRDFSRLENQQNELNQLSI